MIDFKNLSIGFGKKILLNNASGSIPSGKVTGLVAPNGSGKTTFMKALVAAESVRARGAIAADGISIRDEGAYRRAVFYLPGDATILYPLLTVRDNLLIAHRCWGSAVSIDEIAERCRVAPFMNKRVWRLSLGMKQQVALAIGYLTGARYLLLDETMNALDPTNLKTNMGIIRALCDEGKGILLSSHMLWNVDTFADEVMFLKDGSFVRCLDAGETTEAVYSRLYE